MRTRLAAFETHVNQTDATTAACVEFTRHDGTKFGFTELDIDIPLDAYSAGFVTYRSNPGMVRSLLQWGLQFKTDSGTIKSFESSFGFQKDDIRAGAYNDTQFRIFRLNWTNTAHGIERFERGRLGQISLNGGEIDVEAKSLLSDFDQPIVPIMRVNCPYQLGPGGVHETGGGCKVRIDPPVWTATTAVTARLLRDAGSGSVIKPSTYDDRHQKCTTAGTTGGSEPAWNLTIGGTTADGSAVWETIQALQALVEVDIVTSQTVFTITNRSGLPNTDAPDNFWGHLQWDTGPSAILKPQHILSYVDSTKTVTLKQPMYFTITTGDQLTLSAFCDKKTWTDAASHCITRFDNVHNHGGINPPKTTEALETVANAVN